jgi:hypothetical protein
MKTIKILITGVLMVLSSQVWGQENQFFKAFKLNDFSQVESFLDKRIDLGIYDDQHLLPKSEAIQKISNWINNNKVKSLIEIHSGQSSDKKSHYRVAQLSTDEGIFRVFVYVTEKQGKNVIKKVQIDRF